MTFEVFLDVESRWRWRAVSSNGLIVADSGQGYSSRSNARRAARNFCEWILLSSGAVFRDGKR